MNNAGDSVYYFNYFILWISHDFYFDYTSTEHCFLSYNIPDMQCLKAKEGYTIYLNTVIKPDECINYSTKQAAVIYNSYTMECL